MFTALVLLFVAMLIATLLLVFYGIVLLVILIRALIRKFR